MPVCRGRYEHTQPTPRAPALHGCTCLGGAREREALNRGFETCASETWKWTRGFTSVSYGEARGNEAVSHCEPNDTHTSSFNMTGTFTQRLPRRLHLPCRGAQDTGPPAPHALPLVSFPPFPSSALLSVSIRKVGTSQQLPPHPLHETGPMTRNQSWTAILSRLKQAGSNGLKILATGSLYNSTGKSISEK